MKRWAVSAALVWLAAIGVVFAASDRAVDIPERARGARKVVVAKAASVTPSWRRNAHGDELIVSEVVLQVEETMKGEPAGLVWMEVEGGTLGGFTLRVSGLPEVKAGDRGVFFLDETAGGTHVPHLGGQGILKLDADRVRGTSLRVSDVRRMAKGGK